MRRLILTFLLGLNTLTLATAQINRTWGEAVQQPSPFGMDTRGWLPKSSPTSFEIWTLAQEYHQLTDMYLQPYVFYYVAYKYWDNRENRWAQRCIDRGDYVEFALQDRHYYREINWDEQAKLFVPESHKDQLPDSIGDILLNEILKPLLKGESIGIYWEGEEQTVGLNNPTDSVNSVRLGLLWTFRSLVHYAKEGSLPGLSDPDLNTIIAHVKPDPTTLAFVDAALDNPLATHTFEPMPLYDSLYYPAYVAGSLTHHQRLEVVTQPALALSTLRLEGPSGQALLTLKETGKYEVLLPPSGSPGEEQWFITMPEPDDPETRRIIGAVNVVRYAQEQRIVHVIPMDGRDFGQAAVLTRELNRIYAPAGVTWTVLEEAPWDNIAWDKNGDGGVTFEGSGLLTAYPPEMKVLIREYEKAFSVNNDDYYLFYVKAPSDQSGISGFMPRKRQFGFLYSTPITKVDNRFFKLAAHELGHGAFRYAHWWDETQGVIPKGSSYNLMDYGQARSGIYLAHQQWDYVRNPQSVPWFESDSSAMSEFEEQWILHDQILDDLSTSNMVECATRGTAAILVNTAKYGALLGSYSGLLEYGLCITEEEKWEDSPPEIEFAMGFANAVYQEFDVITILELLKGMSMTKLECLRETRVTLMVVGPDPDIDAGSMFQEFNRCLLGMDLGIEEVNQIIALATDFVKQVWEDPYEQGMATEFIVSLFVPGNQFMKVKKIATLSKIAKLSRLNGRMQLFRKISRLSGNKIDELAEILRNAIVSPTTNLKNIIRSSEFKGILSQLQNPELFTPTSRRLADYATVEAFEAKFTNLYNRLGGDGVQSFDKVVDDFHSLIKKHGSVENVADFIDEMMQSRRKFKGGAFGLEVLANPPPQFSGKRLIRFEAGIDDLDDFRFDLEFSDGSKITFVELKNYGANTNLSASFFKQYGAYIGTASNENSFVYFFRANPGVDRASICAKVKSMIKANVDELFDRNPGYFRRFDRLDGKGKIRNVDDLEELINDKVFNSSHPFFDNIIVF